MAQWACCYDASFRGKGGSTGWGRRFGEKVDFTVYPFGALVVFKPAGPGIKLVGGDDFNKRTNKKWRSRLVPALLVGTAQTPGCAWAK